MTIAPGKTYQLSPRVRRITAPNGGRMTGPGTNTYLVGDGDELAVIDPGPAIESHVEAILNATDGRIRRVLVTHTHADHSPAAGPLVDATGAEVLGCPLRPSDGHQDESLHVNREISHGEIIEGGGYRLQAIHTPGHIGNHFCYLLAGDNMLFAGDHIMEGVSVVIVPPSGDLKDFLDSLTRLRNYSIDAIAPGHGHLIEDPVAEFDKLARHRRYRENKVLEALEKLGEGSLDSLLPLAYDDVDPELHKVARYSLWAHLLKLEREGRAVRTIEKHWAFGEEHWKPA